MLLTEMEFFYVKLSNFYCEISRGHVYAVTPSADTHFPFSGDIIEKSLRRQVQIARNVENGCLLLVSIFLGTSTGCLQSTCNIFMI